MSNEIMHTDTSVDVPVEVHHHEEHAHQHHHETFITKYVFSQDHKMIAKQFLITGMVWGVLGGLMSVLFRLQLGYPDQSFPWLQDLLGKWWFENGHMTATGLLCIGYNTRNCSCIFCIDCRLKRNICQSFNSTTSWCKRYGFADVEYVELLVFLFGKYSDGFKHLCFNRTIQRWLDSLPAIKRFA